VASASVTIDSHLVSSIGKGVLVFAAVDRDDSAKEVESMAAKVLKMKMWPDDNGGAVCSFSLERSSSLIKDLGGNIAYKILRARCSAVPSFPSIVD